METSNFLYFETGCQKIPNSVVGGVEYWAEIFLLEEFNIKFY